MKNKQGITIAALIIAIVGLSIGFAAFANTLTISSSASVTPDPTSMNVVFSSSSSSAQIDPITPTKNLDNVTNFTATNATITGADYRTLNNVSAAFTEPGQNVTYNLYVYNAGSYKAYLNELNMGTKTCSIVENQEHPEQEATESLKNAACEGISITVKIDNVTLTSSGSLNNMELNVESSKPVQIVISYASGSAYVDGPISVSFGNITFTASTVQAQSQIGEDTPAEPQNNNSDYVVVEQDGHGIISKYIGTETSLTIPSQLPVSTFTLDNFDVASCMSQNESTEEECIEERDDLINGTGKATLSDVYTNPEDYTYATVSRTVSNNTILVTEIASGAFERKGLTSVTIGDNITEIGREAFFRNSLQTVIIGSGVTLIGTDAFNNNQLQNVTINVACDTYKDAFTNSGQFHNNDGFSIDNIVWGTACTN